MTEYSDATPLQREKLLWLVFDEAHEFLQQSRERAVPLEKKLDQAFLLIAHLALALAGGYREDGTRQ